MATDNTQISKADEADLDSLLSLLTLVGLPQEGVREHLSGFFVARNQENRLLVVPD